mgnify:CR=1 FL=1
MSKHTFVSLGEICEVETFFADGQWYWQYNNHCPRGGFRSEDDTLQDANNYLIF